MKKNETKSEDSVEKKKMKKMFGGEGTPKAMEKMMKRMGGKIPGLGNLQVK